MLNSIVSENKDLDDAAKNLEKNKPKKGEKNNISVKENEGSSILNKEKKKVGSKKVENDILKDEKVSMPEKNKKLSNEKSCRENL